MKRRQAMQIASELDRRTRAQPMQVRGILTKQRHSFIGHIYGIKKLYNDDGKWIVDCFVGGERGMTGQEGFLLKDLAKKILR